MLLADVRSIADEPRVIAAMHRARALAEAVAARAPSAHDARVLADAVSDDDPIVAIGALHALGRVRHPLARRALAAQLDATARWRREHAVWALGHAARVPVAIPRLLELVEAGGFASMLAQMTLEQGARARDGRLASAIRLRLDATTSIGARGRLVETLGLDDHPSAMPLLEEIAEGDDHLFARIAAISALGARHSTSSRALLARLAQHDDEIGTHALLAMNDQAMRRRPQQPAGSRMRVAQLYLHADLDPDLRRAGAGDNGGIASLLMLLSAALADQPEIERVLTLARGTTRDALADAVWPRSDAAVIGSVPFPRGPLADSWEHRVAVERGIRRQLVAHGPIDVLHLRMADVGTLVARRVARSLGIAVDFTAAPDPHAVIDSLDRQGRLTRSEFGERDAAEHWWFRARLAEDLARDAHALALLPRPRVRAVVADAFGVAAADLEERSSIIPEGVSGSIVAQAADDAARFAEGGSVAVLGELQERLARLPVDRRALPPLITAGRLHRQKGVERLVEAWAGSAVLRTRFNLVIVGGELDDPSPEEQAVLAAIARVPDTEQGLVMLGHRPHLDTARLLADAARRGGVYVCASEKEEFGLAIVEALAAGLVPVAPIAGGPSTYLRDGETGVLCDTSSVPGLAAAIERAAGLVDRPGRAERAREQVLTTLTIEQMAEALAGLYPRAVERCARAVASLA